MTEFNRAKFQTAFVVVCCFSFFLLFFFFFFFFVFLFCFVFFFCCFFLFVCFVCLFFFFFFFFFLFFLFSNKLSFGKTLCKVERLNEQRRSRCDLSSVAVKQIMKKKSANISWRAPKVTNRPDVTMKIEQEFQFFFS